MARHCLPAVQGLDEIRRYILENDLLDALCRITD
jgi:hypothetical protein